MMCETFPSIEVLENTYSNIYPEPKTTQTRINSNNKS